MRWWLRAVVVGLVMVGLVACGGSNPGGDLGDGGGGGGGGDDEPYWEYTRQEDTDVVTVATGASVVRTQPNQIVLSDSTPTGWTITFTADDPFDGTVLAYASDEATRPVSATMTAPSGDSCSVVAPSAGLGVILTVVFDEDGVPNGTATFVDLSPACLASDIQGGGSIGFGAP